MSKSIGETLDHRVRTSVGVVIHAAEEGGYWAEAKGLPGCFSQGETLAEVKRNIRAAIDLYLSPKKGPRAPKAPAPPRRKAATGKPKAPARKKLT